MTDPEELSQQVYTCAISLFAQFTPFEVYDFYRKKYDKLIAYDALGFSAMDEYLETLPFLVRIPDPTRMLFSLRQVKIEPGTENNEGLDSNDMAPEDLPTISDIAQILKEQGGQAISAKRLSDVYLKRFGIRLTVREKKRLSGSKSFVEALEDQCKDLISYRHSTVEFYQLTNQMSDAPCDGGVVKEEVADDYERDEESLVTVTEQLILCCTKLKTPFSVEDIFDAYKATTKKEVPLEKLGYESSLDLMKAIAPFVQVALPGGDFCKAVIAAEEKQKKQMEAIEQSQLPRNEQSTEEEEDSSDSELSEDDDSPDAVSGPTSPKNLTLSDKAKAAALLKLKGVLLNLLEKTKGRASIEEVRKMYLETNGEELDPVALVGMDWTEFLKEIKKEPLKITARLKDGIVYLRNPNCAWFAYKKQRSLEKKQEAACDRIVALLKKNGGKATFEELCDFYKTEFDVELDPTERRNLSGVGSKADFCRFLKGYKEKIIVILRKNLWFLWTPEVYQATEAMRARTVSRRSRRIAPSHAPEMEGEHGSSNNQKANSKKPRIRSRAPTTYHSSSQETLPITTNESSSSQLDSTTGGSQESVIDRRQEAFRNVTVRDSGAKRKISESRTPRKSKMPRLEKEPPVVVAKPLPPSAAPNGSQEKPELVRNKDAPPVESILDVIKAQFGFGVPFTVDQLQTKYRSKCGHLILGEDYGFHSVTDLLVAQRHLVRLQLPQGHFFSFIKPEEDYDDVTAVVKEMTDSGELPGAQVFQHVTAFGHEPKAISRWPEVLPHLNLQQLNLLAIKEQISDMLPVSGAAVSLDVVRCSFFQRTFNNLSPEHLLLMSWDRFLCELRKDPISITAKFSEDGGWTLQTVQRHWPEGRFSFREALCRAIVVKQDEGRQAIQRIVEYAGGLISLPELQKKYQETYGIPLCPAERYRLTGVAGYNKFIRVLGQKEKTLLISRSAIGVWHLATYEFALRQQNEAFEVCSSVEYESDEEDGANPYYSSGPIENSDKKSTNTSSSTEGIGEKAVDQAKEVEFARQEEGQKETEAIEKDLFEETPMDCGEVSAVVLEAQNPEKNNTVVQGPSANDVHSIKTSVSSEAVSTASDPAKPPTGFATDQTPALLQPKQEIPDTPTSSRDVKPPFMAQSPRTPAVSKYAHFGQLFVNILEQADRNGEDVDAIVLRTMNALYGK